MCGLIAWLNPLADADQARFAAALDFQHHRGPDDTVAVYEPGIWLGHNRLAIIDLSAHARQPMQSADGRFTLVYNGEIYNYVELRDELKRLGHAFRSSGDTEVVLAAFSAWGEDAFRRFNGMWALAIWDHRERRLTICRDRYGIKPLYMARAGGGWIVASEIKPILQLRETAPQLDRSAFIAFFAEGLSDALPNTWFQGIERVPPATSIVIESDNRMRKSCWYRLPAERDLQFADVSDEFYALIEDVVAISLRSDVPVGICLSGGIDSSVLAVIAAERQPIHAFTARHRQPDSDEYAHAEAVVDGRAIILHEAWPAAENACDDLAGLVWHLEEPAKATGVYSQWQVMRAARDHVKVLLDGQGGDEVFAGYSYQQVPFLLGLLNRRNFRAFSAEARTIGWRDTARLIAGDLIGRIVRPLRGIIAPLADGLRVRQDPFPRHIRSEIRAAQAAAPRAATSLSERLKGDIYRDSLPSLLRYEDKVSMAFSIESRVPLLDHRLVDLTFRLRDTDLLRGGWTKLPLRSVLERLGASGTAKRRDKRGFPTPLNVYLDPFAERIRSALLNGSLVEHGLFDRGGLAAALVDTARDPHHRLPWQFLQAEWWMRNFIEGDWRRPLPLLSP